MSRENLNEQGFMFIEILIALVIISIAIIGYMGGNVVLEKKARTSGEQLLAMQDAGQVMEFLRNVGKSGDFPEDLVTSYPDGGSISGYDNLRGQSIAVSYDDVAANPLGVTVTVSWTDFEGRNRVKDLKGWITQRV